MTGVSNQWCTKIVTFDKPYKHTPIVTVSHADSSEGTFWGMPMIQNIMLDTFEYGWYNVSGTHKTKWQSIGEI